MSEQMTLEQVRDALNEQCSCCPMDELAIDELVSAIDTHLAQHAAMVAKLRELANGWRTGIDVARGICDGYAVKACQGCMDDLEAILSTEQAGSDDNPPFLHYKLRPTVEGFENDGPAE